MDEGAVPQHRDGAFGKLFALRALDAAGHANACAHTQARVNGGERGQRAKGIATNIAHHAQAELIKRMEHATVRTARAQHRRAGGEPIRPSGGHLLAQNGVLELFHAQLALNSCVDLALYFDTGGPDIFLDQAFQLLHDDQLLHLGGKLANELHG